METKLRLLPSTILIAALLSGCGGSSNDSFQVYYSAPTWSADGKHIAYIASGDLYVTKLGSGTTRHTQVAERNEAVVDPQWSPRGRRIAYDVCGSVGKYCFSNRIVVRDLGNRRNLVVSRAPEALGSCHVWSPDGRRILFLTTRDGGPFNAYVNVVRSDGRGLRRLAKGESAVGSCPSWSPDGRSVAYICCGDAGDVYVMGSDGRRKRRLTRGMYASEASWSPDGKRIAFHRISDGGETGYVSIELDGGGIASVAPAATGLIWSPDGRRIAYLSDDNERLYVAAADGSSPRVVARGACCPSWSPSGRQLAFVRDDADGKPGIYVMRASGTGLTKISVPPLP